MKLPKVGDRFQVKYDKGTSLYEIIIDLDDAMGVIHYSLGWSDSAYKTKDGQITYSKWSNFSEDYFDLLTTNQKVDRANLCTCKMQSLMSAGCRCGGN